MGEDMNVPSLVKPKDKIIILTGMLNDFPIEKAGMLDDEIHGTVLMKLIMEIVKQWRRT